MWIKNLMLSKVELWKFHHFQLSERHHYQNKFDPIFLMPKGKRIRGRWGAPNVPRCVKKKVITGQVGTITKEKLLNISFININGLNFQSSCNVQTYIDSQSPHILCILETKKKFSPDCWYCPVSKLYSHWKFPYSWAKVRRWYKLIL